MKKANRLRPQEVLAGLAGVALLVSLFLPWVDIDCGPGCDVSANGWDSLSLIDLILAFIAAGAVALPIVAATNSKSDAPITGDALVALGGMIAVLLVLFRLIDPPGDGARGIGPMVALVASGLMVVGAWTAMHDEGTSGPPA